LQEIQNVFIRTPKENQSRFDICDEVYVLFLSESVYPSGAMTSQEIQDQVYQMGKNARAAALALAVLSEEKKNEILKAMAAGIRAASAKILAANAQDIAAGEQRGLTSAMLDRLRLDEARLEAVAAGVEKVATLSDPVGEILGEWKRPNGIAIQQIRVPIGVIGIIYESRPNVTSDAAVLCLKSGNATILRGGSEAIHSNRALAEALQKGGQKAGLPEGAIQLIPFTDRESVAVMAGMDRYLDLIIPRGGKGLIETVVSLARMPVIKHYDGICHAYVHADADLEMATRIVVDAKTQKPSVCNALETLLVDEKVAAEFLPKVAQELSNRHVELRGDQKTREILEVKEASEEDWQTEYLDYILSIKVVSSLDEAINHINTYSSQHTEVIVTQDHESAERFMCEIDSACVFHNVSTRFSDGEEFGFGAEIGISTDKLHARGPMGLRELTSYQYRVRGDGQLKALQ
jgi:glutamate-5-semialdehyde dehydrogenase